MQIALTTCLCTNGVCQAEKNLAKTVQSPNPSVWVLITLIIINTLTGPLKQPSQSSTETEVRMNHRENKLYFVRQTLAKHRIQDKVHCCLLLKGTRVPLVFFRTSAKAGILMHESRMPSLQDWALDIIRGTHCLAHVHLSPDRRRFAGTDKGPPCFL